MGNGVSSTASRRRKREREKRAAERERRRITRFDKPAKPEKGPTDAELRRREKVRTDEEDASVADVGIVAANEAEGVHERVKRVLGARAKAAKPETIESRRARENAASKRGATEERAMLALNALGIGKGFGVESLTKRGIAAAGDKLSNDRSGRMETLATSQRKRTTRDKKRREKYDDWQGTDLPGFEEGWMKGPRTYRYELALNHAIEQEMKPFGHFKPPADDGWRQFVPSSWFEDQHPSGTFSDDLGKIATDIAVERAKAYVPQVVGRKNAVLPSMLAQPGVAEAGGMAEAAVEGAPTVQPRQVQQPPQPPQPLSPQEQSTLSTLNPQQQEAFFNWLRTKEAQGR